MLLQFLDSDLAADKEISVSKFVNTRVDSGSRRYKFRVTEWVDLSDFPETLIAHANLPFLALRIEKDVKVSSLVQKKLTEAQVKIREENHTDIPHTMECAERDVLHEISQHIGFEGNIPNNLLIMNCDYNNRPEIVKKRHYMLATLVGCGAFIRNALKK